MSISVTAQQTEKTYKVLAACGSCHFNMPSETGCALAIQIAGKHYWVDGSNLSDHGDEHAENGLCKVIRKAEVVGKIKDNRIQASCFVLVDDKKKKK